MLGHRITGLDHPVSSVMPSAQPFSVGWVDASRLTRECLVSAVLSTQPLFTIQAFETVEECLAERQLEPDLIVYYSHAEDRVDVGAIETLREAFPSARLVVLSDAATVDPSTVRDILTQGVSGFILTRRTGLQMVMSAISLVHSGGTFVPRDFLFMEQRPAPILGSRKGGDGGRLTQRELAVLDLIRHGDPNKAIADTLGMSASTVKVHVRNIMQKMGVSNRTQVALTAEHFLRSDTRPDKH